MIKTPISLRDLRRRIYRKAKAEPAWRFWGLEVHVCKLETLREAFGWPNRITALPESTE
jgi:RNA-directed DNA polymerase